MKTISIFILPQINKEFLFDLKTDPEETRNKANSPLYFEKTKEMRDQLIAYFKKEGYGAPIEGDTLESVSQKRNA